METAGTDVPLEIADVSLMADDRKQVVYALELARRTRSVVRQNLALSALVISVLVVGTVTGEFVVFGSGLRILRV